MVLVWELFGINLKTSFEEKKIHGKSLIVSVCALVHEKITGAVGFS